MKNTYDRVISIIGIFSNLLSLISARTKKTTSENLTETKNNNCKILTYVVVYKRIHISMYKNI